MQKLISTIILLTLAFYGCKQSTEPQQPTQQKPPGYQEDVPWPSLADSPWPMEHHDPQSTGRSKYSGPEQFNVYYKNEIMDLHAGIVSGIDSLIYAASNFLFYSIHLNGQIIYQNSFGEYTLITPLVNNQNQILINYEYNPLFSISQAGDTLWNFDGNGLFSQLNIGKDGTIFCGGENKLYAINNNGITEWMLIDDRIGYSFASSISPDGNMLYLSTTSNSGLLAIDLTTKTISWEFGSFIYSYAPLVDSDGNIYFSTESDGSHPSGFYSITREGKVNWYFAHNLFNWHVPDHTPPTIDKNGNIYFAADSIYSFNYEGKLRWKKYIPNISRATPLVCDSDNNIYITLNVTGKWGLVKINSNGEILLETPADAFEGESTAYSPMLLDKLLVMPTQGKFIYLLK